MTLFEELGGGLFAAVVIIFLVVWAVVWLFLPFAVFGIKSRLDSICFFIGCSNDYLIEIRNSAQAIERNIDTRRKGLVTIEQQLSSIERAIDSVKDEVRSIDIHMN